jgi:hypothetical protein
MIDAWPDRVRELLATIDLPVEIIAHFSIRIAAKAFLEIALQLRIARSVREEQVVDRDIPCEKPNVYLKSDNENAQCLAYLPVGRIFEKTFQYKLKGYRTSHGYVAIAPRVAHVAQIGISLP